MENKRGDVGCFVLRCSLQLVVFALTCHLCSSEKIRYTSDKDCDRHSLDALYHEKYKLITSNIFADSKEFVNRVTDLVADSLTTVLAQLPDRDVSGNEEKRVHTQFKTVKSSFKGKVKKMEKNITASWEDLIASHFDLMFDNEKSSLEDYLNKTIRMTDAYSAARKTLDTLMSNFIDFLKGTVQDGLLGIKAAAEMTVKKEEEIKKKNETEGAPAEDSNEKNKSKEDIVGEKMAEIAKMIVPGFLKKITVQAIERKMDLTKKSGIEPENRDSVLDDILFDMLMVKNRILAISKTDVRRDKGSTNLARRSIYTYWADLADQMYQDKLKSIKSKDKSNAGRLYYRNLWNDEEETLETLLNLMEVFP